MDTLRETMRETSDEVVVNGEGVAACPHCGAVGRIVEQDSCIRHNGVELTVESGKVVAAHVTQEDSDFFHDRYFCLECLGTVELPADVDEIWD